MGYECFRYVSFGMHILFHLWNEWISSFDRFGFTIRTDSNGSRKGRTRSFDFETDAFDTSHRSTFSITRMLRTRLHDSMERETKGLDRMIFDPRRCVIVFAPFASDLGTEANWDPFSMRFVLRSLRDPIGTTRRDRARNDARETHVWKLRVSEGF